MSRASSHVDGLLVARDRGRAVVVGDAVEPEQLGLQRVPAPRDVVGALDGLDEGLHGLVAGLVGEVARRQPGREPAQPIVDGLVVQQRVEQIGAGAQARLERPGDRFGRRAADIAIGGLEPAERHVESDRRLGVRQRHLDGARQLAEQAHPGVTTADRLLGQQLLLRLGEKMGPVGAGVAQVVATLVEAVGGQQAIRRGVVEARPLEVEEEQGGLDDRGALLEALHERSVLGRPGVGAEPQRGVVAGAPREVADGAEFGHRRGEAGTVEGRDLAGVLGGKGGRPFGCLVEQAIHAGRTVPVDEILEVPGDGLQVGRTHLREST